MNYGEYPGAYPTAIWPFVKPNQELTSDTSLFQYQFYRPLYMYGVGDKVELNAGDSLASAPVWSSDGKSITITMKGWKWSNGETVNADDVLFWLNMAHAEKDQSAYYTPPNKSLGADYLPDNILSATASGNTLTLNLDKSYSQTWYLENQLTQITPMPVAWDMTSATTKGSCATGTYGAAATDAACAADWKYLSVQSTDGASFATSSMWGVVDGPFKLKSYNVSSGAWSMVPNADYSGADKSYLSLINFVPYTSDTAEDAALRAGSSGANGLDIGYLDEADQPVYDAANPNSDNPLKNKGYTFAPMNLLNGIQYYELNFANTDTGPMLSQAYFKRAIQETVDQVGADKSIYKGWTFPTTGAIPSGVGDEYSSTQLNANTFNIANAKQLLTQHGWNTATTPATCADPGSGANQCGAGVKLNQKAEYSLDYLSGNSSAQLLAEDMQSDAKQAGIQINLNQKSENAIGNEDSVCAGSTKSGCWQALLYGGWVYAPQVDPTGEPLFMTGAGANTMSYTDPSLDTLIYNTTTQSAASVMDQYEDALSQNQPVIYIPNTPGNVGQPFIPEIVNNLHVGNSDPFEGYEPQLWYYTKS